MDLVRRDVRPSSIVDRRAIDNAIASVAATGGSTNGVLHLLAIAHAFGIPLDIDDFDTISDRTPLIADLRPGGQYRALELYQAGGVGLVTRELLKRGLIDGDAPTVTGQTLRQIADATVETPGQVVVKPIETAHQAHRRPRHPAWLAGARWLRHQARRPRAPISPRPGQGVRLRDRVLRGGQAAGDPRRRRGRHPLRGTGRRTGHAGDAGRHRRARGRGSG